METISSDFLGITSQYEHQAQRQSINDFLEDWYLKNPDDLRDNLYEEYVAYLAENPYEDIRPNIDPSSNTVVDDTMIRVGPLSPIHIIPFNYIIREHLYKRIQLLALTSNPSDPQQPDTTLPPDPQQPDTNPTI